VLPEIPERGSKTKVNSASRLSNVWNFFVWRDPNDFLSRLVTMDQDGILLTEYLPKDQTSLKMAIVDRPKHVA
jgi:hypothetical protein